MAKQITIFADNKPGRLKKITETLMQENINIRAMTLQDRGEFGLVNLLVDKPEQANVALAHNGFASTLKDVLAIVMDDQPGGLYNIIDKFSTQDINIENAYGFVIDSSKTAVFCVEVQDSFRIKNLIEKMGFKILTDEQLYEL